ncbi:unnamed protein product [Cylindrotheca closterium]|uniref:Serine protease n=1 Tax=Cylindrotheca closterium TaxID=2856 RepID=A0AAD2G859_9STRA|nr:unnamed protein product [Cylindrotheca closterium]
MQSSFLLKAIIIQLLASAAFICGAAAALDEGALRRPGILQIGSHEPIVISSNAYSEIQPTIVRELSKISKTYSFYHPGASYIAVHFQHMNLGEGCSITIQEASRGDMSHSYTGKGRQDLGTFWDHHIYGDSIEIILACEDWETSAEFEVDEYAAGFPEDALRDSRGRKRSLRRGSETTDNSFPPPFIGRDGRELSICGTNDMRNAQCYEADFPTEYNLAGAVAKVHIHGTGVCTGWLVGPNNVFVTNRHCIRTDEEALTSDYIFDFEVEGGGDCNSANIKERSVSEITYEATELLAASDIDDYVLIKLAGNPVSKHGYLELDNRKPNVGENIYIPQHPGGLDKEIAIFDSHIGEGARCEIQTTNSETCFGRLNTGYWDLSYSCDTKGGTSGSPVLSVDTHKVIGLHHCGGGCSIGNVAVPIYSIFNDIKEFLGPAEVVTPNPTPPPTPGPTQSPTPQPTQNPTPRPTSKPTPYPTPNPTPRPTPVPTVEDSTHPTAQKSENPTLDPTPNPTPRPTLISSIDYSEHPTVIDLYKNPKEYEPCPLDSHRFLLDLQTDSNGHETFWIMKDGHGQIFMQVKANTYEDNTFYQLSVCIPSDRYKFTIRDTGMDGITGEHGDGYFQVYLDGALVIRGDGDFGLKDQYTFETW